MGGWLRLDTWPTRHHPGQSRSVSNAKLKGEQEARNLLAESRGGRVDPWVRKYGHYVPHPDQASELVRVLEAINPNIRNKGSAPQPAPAEKKPYILDQSKTFQPKKRIVW